MPTLILFLVFHLPVEAPMAPGTGLGLGIRVNGHGNGGNSAPNHSVTEDGNHITEGGVFVVETPA